MRTEIVYSLLANLIQARQTCLEKNNSEWLQKHGETIKQIVRDLLPSGSGWDCGTKIDLSLSKGDKLVFFGEFHHMDENGMYDGWTNHFITIKPSLIHQIEISISGRNRNDIKEYLHEIFHSMLTKQIFFDETKQTWRDIRYAFI